MSGRASPSAPETESPHAQLRRDLLQLARLLQRPDRIQNRVGDTQQHQRDLLVEIKLPVPRRIQFAPHVAQPRERRQQVPQPLDPTDLFRVDLPYLRRFSR